MRVLIAGGGTGGHLFPAFAVARTVRQLHTDAEISWLGGARGVESRLVPEAGYPLTLLAAPSLRPSGAGCLRLRVMPPSWRGRSRRRFASFVECDPT